MNTYSPITYIRSGIFPYYTSSGSFRQLHRALQKLCCSWLVVQPGFQFPSRTWYSRSGKYDCTPNQTVPKDHKYASTVGLWIPIPLHTWHGGPAEIQIKKFSALTPGYGDHFNLASYSFQELNTGGTPGAFKEWLSVTLHPPLAPTTFFKLEIRQIAPKEIPGGSSFRVKTSVTAPFRVRAQPSPNSQFGSIHTGRGTKLASKPFQAVWTLQSATTGSIHLCCAIRKHFSVLCEHGLSLNTHLTVVKYSIVCRVQDREFHFHSPLHLIYIVQQIESTSERNRPLSGENVNYFFKTRTLCHVA